MFLLLALCRTDISPTADHVFKKALKTLLQLPEIPNAVKSTG
jgi:DNA-3-methyladenine glycosylase II